MIQAANSQSSRLARDPARRMGGTGPTARTAPSEVT